MDYNSETTYPWESLEVDSLVLPTELLAYYLHKHGLDKKAKKDTQEKEDLSLIYHYLNILEIEKEVHIDVSTISK